MASSTSALTSKLSSSIRLLLRQPPTPSIAGAAVCLTAKPTADHHQAPAEPTLSSQLLHGAKFAGECDVSSLRRTDWPLFMAGKQMPVIEAAVREVPDREEDYDEAEDDVGSSDGDDSDFGEMDGEFDDEDDSDEFYDTE